jgi:hypothetical protein
MSERSWAVVYQLPPIPRFATIPAVRREEVEEVAEKGIGAGISYAEVVEWSREDRAEAAVGENEREGASESLWLCCAPEIMTSWFLRTFQPPGSVSASPARRMSTGGCG